MKKQGPHSEVGNTSEHSGGFKQDPVSRRAAIAARARKNPKEQFNSLLHHLTYELVEECLNKIPKSSAVGIDGMTVEQARENLSWLLPPILRQIHEGRYEAPAVRRVYIPKADGKKRPLGIPAVIDRAIQAAMSRILNEIYEQDFLKSSFGFRPGLSCHHALATINEILYRRKAEYVLEVDIQDFFGSLSHEWLKKFLRLRIGDERVLKLIEAWLSAGVMENGQLQVGEEKGTPQGGSVSPLLANIYLHYVLDLWFEKKIKQQFNGRANLVRYADDFALFFNKASDVTTMQTLLMARLAQFGLSISEKKTHQTHLGLQSQSETHKRRRMTFLGFTIYRAKNRSGTGGKTVFVTDSLRYGRAKAAIKAKISQIQHRPIAEQVQILNSSLMGHFNYYGIAGNGQKLHSFSQQVRWDWRHSLSRWSQNGRVTWDKYQEILDKHPLVFPKIKIQYQDLSTFARL